MMNYVWSALLLAALGFALWFDFTDLSEDRYANGRPLPVALELPNTLDDRGVGDKPVRVSVHLPAGDLAAHFAGNDTAGATDLSAAAELVRLPDGYELRITETSLPAPLAAIRAFSDESNKILRARVLDLEPGISTQAMAQRVNVRLELPAVRFVKLRAITTAAFDFAKTAATLALGFIGIFALWMGLMKIAEASGLISIFVMLVQPFLRLLFPEVPKGHPALGMIAMNLAANMLGLGNAATPMGIKAMEQLQTINPKKDTASNPMVMLLAMNTAGVQLLPSATLVAVMGMSSMRVFIPIMIVTGISLIVAIVVTKLLSRLPGFRQASSIQEATEVVK